MKFENFVVRSQAGSDPKAEVKSKGINFPKDYNELVEQVHSSNLNVLQSRGIWSEWYDQNMLLRMKFFNA